MLMFQFTDGAQAEIVPDGARMNTPRLNWNVDCFDTVVLFISVPFTYSVLVPKDTGLGISDPLLEHVEDAHVELLYEYEQDTAVPHDMYGDQEDTVEEAKGVRMSILSSGLKAVEV